MSVPCCLIAGGEPTVLVKGQGKGGRNQEFVLHCARNLEGWPDPDTLLAAVATDGSDGPTEAAGAIARPDTIQRARALNLEADDFLRRNDSFHFFEPLGDLIQTGPTGTNVMDLHIALVA